MGMRITIVGRDGVSRKGTLSDDAVATFGRSGTDQVIGLDDSPVVSRRAFEVDDPTGGFVRVSSLQSSGSIEVRRPDGTIAGNLRNGENGSFRGPVDLVLHTTEGAIARVRCEPGTAAWPTAGARDTSPSATRPAWNPANIERPEPGREWLVAAGLAAALIRQGRRTTPNFVLNRGSLLRACTIWLGQPKTEGWLASKFKQAGQALQVNFEGNPAHQLGEYVIQHGLLDDGALHRLHSELDRRRGGR